MKERPILFSAPMVRALLADIKTQTRRIMKPQPTEWWAPVNELIEIHGRDRTGELNPDIVLGRGYCSGDGEEGYACPYGQPGDRLWVRETIRIANTSCDDACLSYPANGGWRELGPGSGDIPDSALVGYFKLIDKARRKGGKCSVPSIHMPRWASRITLEITDVRVQRLQEINEADVIAEGAKTFPQPGGGTGYVFEGTGYDQAKLCHSSADIAFSRLWEEINGDDSWDLNPWCWALTFKRITP